MVPMAILHFRYKERRRTVRVMLSVPLRVSGHTQIGERFSIKALSHCVSLHGASIELELEVVLGEILQLENEITKEKVDGKVVSIRRMRDGKKYVAIEFVSKDANFWHMAFPVPGAKPLRRPISSKVSSM
jgi:PilZ domain